jgi:hypothetical protein
MASTSRDLLPKRDKPRLRNIPRRIAGEFLHAKEGRKTPISVQKSDIVMKSLIGSQKKL